MPFPLLPGGGPFRPRGFGGGPLAFVGGMLVGGFIENAREQQYERQHSHPIIVQAGSAGQVVYVPEGQRYAAYPPKNQVWNQVPPPPGGAPEQDYYSTPVQPRTGQSVDQVPPANPQETVREAFDSVKDITKLDFYVQRGAEADTPGALRAKAGDLGSMFDQTGKLNSTGQQLLDPNGTGLFAYDKLHNEIYTTKPADQIDPSAIADFQRKSWAIREGVEGNPDEAMRKLSAIQGADANPNATTVKGALDVASGQTHLDFSEKDGVLRAKMDGLFHHRSDNLNKLFDQDPKFMQALLGNGNIIYDRDHGEVQVRNPEQTSLQTITDFQRNAEAIGLAADGKFAEAHAKWNAIHGADQGAGGQQVLSQDQSRTGAAAGQTTSQSTSPHTLDDLNSALTGTGLTFRADDKGNWVTDAGKIKDMSDDDRKKLIGDGLAYDPNKNVLAIVDKNNIDIDDLKGRAPAIVAQRGDLTQGQQQETGRTDQGTQGRTDQPAGPAYQDFSRAPKQDIVAEAQIMLETLHEKGIQGNNKLTHGINDVNHQGIDGLQGRDTDTALKEFKRLMDLKSLPAAKGFDSELNRETFTRLVQNFQKVEGLDETGVVDQKTLDKMRTEQTDFSKKMQVQHEVKEGMEVSSIKGQQPTNANDVMYAANNNTRTSNGSLADVDISDAIKSMGGKIVLESANIPSGPQGVQIAVNTGDRGVARN